MMPLAAFARLLGMSPKWVLNVMRALSLTPPYTLELARRLAVTRAVHESAGMPLLAAYPVAGRALDGWNGEETCVIQSLTDDISLTIDVYRLLVSLNTRLAAVRESYAPMVRGRPQVKRMNALDAATAWGLDLTLLRDNAARTPCERLRQLDAMLAFAKNVQRGTIDTRRPDV